MNEPTEAEIQTAAIACREPFPLIPPEAKAPITAAQAKVEAVANLTMKAYERASTLVLTAEEIAAIQKEFPDDAFYTGAGGNEKLIYIQHSHLRDRLNQVFSPGQWAIIPRNRWAEDFKTAKGDDASRVYCECMLLIRGCFVAEAVGDMVYYKNNATQNYGDAVEGAKSAALRRCAKELGIGLQAWKKEFCEGWWKRHNQRPQGVQVQRPEPAKPVVKETVTTAAKPFPTKDSLTKALIALQAAPNMDGRNLVHEYFVKAGAILPTESLEDLPLRFCPNTPGLLRAVGAAIANFEAGEEALLAFKPHEEPESQAGALKTAQKPQENGGSQPDPQQASGWFMGVIVPVPRKGMKRDEYLKHPDTIGSLFEARHDDTADGQEARQRLWGFVNNYEPKGWTKRNGEQMPASDGDKNFRLALDAFQEWFEKAHPGEKL